jgi:hypothetical protein
MRIFRRWYFLYLLCISFFVTNYIYTHVRDSDKSQEVLVGEDEFVPTTRDKKGVLPEDFESSTPSPIKLMHKKSKKNIRHRSKPPRKPSSVKRNTDVPWGQVHPKSAAKK